jgi:hypothetical protein
MSDSSSMSALVGLPREDEITSEKVTRAPIVADRPVRRRQ